MSPAVASSGVDISSEGSRDSPAKAGIDADEGSHVPSEGVWPHDASAALIMRIAALVILIRSKYRRTAGFRNMMFQTLFPVALHFYRAGKGDQSRQPCEHGPKWHVVEDC